MYKCNGPAFRVDISLVQVSVREVYHHTTAVCHDVSSVGLALTLHTDRQSQDLIQYSTHTEKLHMS